VNLLLGNHFPKLTLMSRLPNLFEKSQTTATVSRRDLTSIERGKELTVSPVLNRSDKGEWAPLSCHCLK
jgi:hypothetical protein